MTKNRIPAVLLVVVGLSCGGHAVGQEKKVELKESYTESFAGPASKHPAWGLYGPQAKSTVKFEPEGLRIQLPAGVEGQRPANGVTTRIGVKGDFQVTARYEILQEPAPEDGKSPTRLTMDVVFAPPHYDAATLSRRVVRAGKQSFAWMSLWDADAGKAVSRSLTSVPAKAMTGRLRIERTGTNIAYSFGEADDDTFTRVSVAPFSTDDVAEVRLIAATSGATASLDVRFKEIEVRGEKITKAAAAPQPADFAPPAKDYAQEYRQSFTKMALPAGWELVGPAAEDCVRFEPAGLRINLPAGWGGERQGTGIKSSFGVQGDFDMSLAFDMLAEPSAADSGKAGTRLSIQITKETPHSNIATISRSIGMTNGSNFVPWQSLWNEPAKKGVISANVFSTKTKTGRLRLVRSGPHLYYGFAEGPDGDYRFRANFTFGPEDLREIRIIASTGGEQAAIEARATDFRLRADAIPRAPAAPPAAADQADGPAADPPAPSRAWLKASLLIGAIIVVLMLAILGVGFFLMGSRKAPAQSSKAVVKKRK